MTTFIRNTNHTLAQKTITDPASRTLNARAVRRRFRSQLSGETYANATRSEIYNNDAGTLTGMPNHLAQRLTNTASHVTLEPTPHRGTGPLLNATQVKNKLSANPQIATSRISHLVTT